MSWLFGVTGQHISDKLISRCRAIHTRETVLFVDPSRFYFAAGGLPETCLFGQSQTSGGQVGEFWVSLGCAFLDNGPTKKILSQNDWAALSDTQIDSLDGHFVHLRAGNRKIVFRTDRIGLRTLYWAEASDEIVFSTRLDWVAAFVGGAKIDFGQLGSRWLLYNQLSYESPVVNIRRLGPSGKLTIEEGKVVFSSKPFDPDFSRSARPEDFEQTLWKFLRPQESLRQTRSFGLSGGFDSRTLLSMLLHSEGNAVQTHSFGTRAEPDVSMAARIARGEGFRHFICEVPPPTAGEALALLRSYVAQTNLAEPGHGVLKLRQYERLDPRKFYLVDGAFGEISRRFYMNRLLIKGVGGILRRDIATLKHALRQKRGEFFVSEVMEQMNKGIERDLGMILDTMPDPRSIGFGNYLDLWVVRTRVPNYGADEQARVDGIILNYMPFVQPSLLACMFAIPEHARKGSKLFKRIISRYRPGLSKYPLVKNTATVPFGMPKLAAMALARAMTKLGLAYLDPSPDELLAILREFVLDALHSRETSEYAAYDFPKISKMVHSYYAGDKSLRSEVSWWLTFDLWRRGIEHPASK